MFRVGEVKGVVGRSGESGEFNLVGFYFIMGGFGVWFVLLRWFLKCFGLFDRYWMMYGG